MASILEEFNTNSLHSEIFVEPITIENGFTTPPTGPGPGVEINDAVVRGQLPA